MSDLLTQPAVDQLALLADSSISALELAELHIERIEQLNPRLKAIVEFYPEKVRQQACALDGSRAPRGPLHGLPVTIKSSISVSGYRCETGSLLYKGRTAIEDAEVVGRLRAAGAVILGTTNCPEFLMAYDTENRLHGRTSNPWGLDHTPGGSSGGESAAIAAGLSAAGIGSDSGGSVRVPAHFTGICAFKPTPGRIPARGHVPANAGPFATLGALGPMARTMKDVSLLFRVLSGASEIDPAAAPVPHRSPAAADLNSTRIGFFADDGIVPVTPETRAAVRAAAAALHERGFTVEPFRPKALEAARQLWWKFFVRGGLMLLEPEARRHEHLLSPTYLNFRSIATQEPPLTGDELLEAWMQLDQIRSELLIEMHDFPVLLTPVCSVPAFRHGERQWIVPNASGEPQSVDYLDAMRFTQWFNLLGAPAAVLPVGRSPEGLPIGVQIAGRPYADEVVLGIASDLDADFGYKPPPRSMAIQPALSR